MAAAMRPVLVGAALLALTACGSTEPAPGASPPVYVVVFTHIEDNTPAGAPGSAIQRNNYLTLRARLLELAALAKRCDAHWSLQPDWSLLLAALQYEDATVRSSTAGLNLLRYLRDSLGVAVDPHSHEGGGYNYTDVAHLLDSLGVGGSTVIGGHIWDPALPQFQQWDRFRVPVRGARYPSALWRGDILMGSGTPNHVNDPLISGLWRPKSRTSYFEDDPAGNIVGVGAWRGDVAGIAELTALYESRQVDASCLLTASIPIRPVNILAAGGIESIENTVLKPLAALRDADRVVLTDFTQLIATWKRERGANACTYRLGP